MWSCSWIRPVFAYVHRVLGKSHLLVGSAGFLVAGEPALHQFGVSPRPAEMLAGAVVCAGAAMLPDLDHPEATVTRSLGPLTEIPSGFLSSLAGGHRNGTHSFLFAALAGFGTFLLLGQMPQPWGALLIAFFFPALLIRVLTEARGLVCAGLAMIVSTVVVMGHVRPMVLAVSVGLGCLLHMLGDFVTPEGVPPLWPVSRIRWRFPIVSRTGDNIESVIAGACGLWALWAYLSGIAAPVLLGHKLHVDLAKLPLPHVTTNLWAMALLALAGVGVGVLAMQTVARFKNHDRTQATNDQPPDAVAPVDAADTLLADPAAADDGWVLPPSSPVLADDFISRPDAVTAIEEPLDWPWHVQPDAVSAEGVADPDWIASDETDFGSFVAKQLHGDQPASPADSDTSALVEPIVPLTPQPQPVTDLDEAIRARMNEQPQVQFRPLPAE